MSPIQQSTTVTAIAILLGSMAAHALVRFEFRVKVLWGALLAVIGIGGYWLLTFQGFKTLPAMGCLALVVSILANRLPSPGTVR